MILMTQKHIMILVMAIWVNFPARTIMTVVENITQVLTTVTIVIIMVK